MIWLLAALAAQPAAAPDAMFGRGRTAWIVSTVGHSEWCPAGNVRLDLVSGRYAYTAPARRPLCLDADVARPVSRGILAGQPLAALRTAFARVVAEGPAKPICREGGHPDEIVVSNGGQDVLVLTTGQWTHSPPDDLSCWSEAASGLSDGLDRVFVAPTRR
jgi:hypothetical protein